MRTRRSGEWEELTPELEAEMEEAVSMALSLRLAKCEEDNWYLRERVKELEGAEKQRVGSSNSGSSSSNSGKQEAAYSQRR
jgi:hypothetical protein